MDVPPEIGFGEASRETEGVIRFIFREAPAIFAVYCSKLVELFGLYLFEII